MDVYMSPLVHLMANQPKKTLNIFYCIQYYLVISLIRNTSFQHLSLLFQQLPQYIYLFKLKTNYF